MSHSPSQAALLADLRHRFDEWCKSTEFMRSTTRPVDAGDQMALRDAHDLLVEALAAPQETPQARPDREASCDWNCTLPYPHHGPCAAAPSSPTRETP